MRGRPWTAAEDRAVLVAQPGTLRAIAVQLGRTVGAVRDRRLDLRRRERSA